MIYLLDTNICIYIIKQSPPSVLERFATFTPNQIGISMVTVAELQYGAQKSKYPARNLAALEQFFSPFSLFPFDSSAAVEYGLIRAALEKQGTPIGALDMLIAAQAKSLSAILVTNNIKEFSRVAELTVENWVTAQ